jgi:hypothetical protein
LALHDPSDEADALFGHDLRADDESFFSVM